MAALPISAAKHTPLLFTKDRIAQAKQLIQTDTLRQQGWESIKAEADKQLQRTDLNKAEYLAVAFFMTDDNRYADKLKEILLKTIETKTWINSEMEMRKPAWRSDLGMAHKSYQLAMAYDAAYERMTPSERQKVADGLVRLAVEPALGDWILEPSRIHSINSMGHNWWTSCACMGGLLAMSLRNEVSQAEEWTEQVKEGIVEWFDFAGDMIQGKPKTFDDAGGMYESLNYANFGIQEALLFRVAWINTHPGKDAGEIKQLENLTRYFVEVCYPRTGILYNLNFGDSHRDVAADSSLMLLYALGYKDPAVLWYLAQETQGQHRDGYFLNRPMGMLYTPDFSHAPAEPDYPTSQLFSDLDWATMRTSWDKDATLLAMKCGHTWNHSHADASSFILFDKGIDIIKDGGNCWYPNPAYRNYFFQSEAHNVVLFNGKGQSRQQQYHGTMLRGQMDCLLDGGDMRYVMANATGPYSDNFSRYLRHFLWIDNVVYIIDDLKTHEQGEFQWLYHPNGEVKKSGIDLNITNGEAAVAIRPLWPQTLAKSDFVHDYPDDLYWELIEAPTEDLKSTETYYSFHLPQKTDRVKALTAIIIKDSPKQKELPRMERREGKDWIGLRVTYKGKVTDIYINQLADGRLMHSNSWIEADSWTTDAYMFAVRYDEGKQPDASSDLFLCYGSALRQSSKTIFSSLTKLSLIRKQEGSKMTLQIDGQPKMRASLAAKQKPSMMVVNGEKAAFDYDKGLVKLKMEK